MSKAQMSFSVCLVKAESPLQVILLVNKWVAVHSKFREGSHEIVPVAD